MRLTELKLEKYGCYQQRELVLPRPAGLTVVYGPNEAGKSTCLAAIRDFFYGIGHDLDRGSQYGYSGMRIGATLILADGRQIALVRRKGRGKTLGDSKGTAFDEAVLAPILGPVTEDRFCNLFGLDHATLRSGGESLLTAQGDVGRLIVEAGGGLRALVGRLEKVDADADGLFGRTTKQSRAFSQGKVAYEAAEKDIRAHELKQKDYEMTIKKLEAAKRTLSNLRLERQALATTKGALDRVQRVAPRLRERQNLLAEREEFADTLGYPEEFSRKVRDALAAHAAAKANRDLASERREPGRRRGLTASSSPTICRPPKP